MNCHTISFDGQVLNRGFWLYVIDIRSPDRRVLYVGRTGDSSSPHAGSPFSRIGQHLDVRPNAKGNALFRNLRAASIDPTLCTMSLYAVGPLHTEAADFEAHRPLRDRVAALEKGLAAELRARGHDVLGKHAAKGQPDAKALEDVLSVIELKLAFG